MLIRYQKHQHYNEDSFSMFNPNYFYFVVPEEIQDKAVPYIEKKYPKYGIIVYARHYSTIDNHENGRDFNILKRAKVLPSAPLSDNERSRLLEIIVGRMGSMIIFGIN